MKKQTPHFYGIQDLKKNPLAVNLKLKLSRLLFLHPDYSGEQAARIASVVKNADDAKGIIRRIENEMASFELPFLHSLFQTKLETWFEYHSLPTIEELQDVAAYLRKDIRSLVFELQLKIRLHYSPKEVKRLEILNYASFFSEATINEILDRYIDSNNALEAEIADYLIDYFLFDDEEQVA